MYGINFDQKIIIVNVLQKFVVHVSTVFVLFKKGNLAKEDKCFLMINICRKW